MPGQKSSVNHPADEVWVLDINRLVDGHRDLTARREADPDARNPYATNAGAFLRVVEAPPPKPGVDTDGRTDGEETSTLPSFDGRA